MNNRKRKRRVNKLLYQRFHNSKFIWQSIEDKAWDLMPPVGREFGSLDFDHGSPYCYQSLEDGETQMMSNMEHES